MGWTFYAEPSKGKSDIEAEVTATRPGPRGGYHRTLRKQWSGNRLWCVHESKVDGEIVRYVGLYLCRRDRGRWGYKAMDETMGPFYYDCPPGFLSGLTEPRGCAAEWRAEVARRHPTSSAAAEAMGQQGLF